MDYVIKDTDLTAIANAIRSKNGSSDTYTVAEMDDEINALDFQPTPPAILTNSWDFTIGLVDSVGGLSATLGNNATQDSNGITISDVTQYVAIPVQIAANKTYEVDFGSLNKTFGSVHGRVFMYNSSSGLIFQSGSRWNVYSWAWDPKTGGTDPTVLNGKTLKVTTHPLNIVANGSEYSAFMMQFYIDNVLWHTMQSYQTLPTNSNITIGAATQSFANMTVTAIRVYDNFNI